ncbi:MAG TPA: YHS domain-containing protein [Armatimonadota bacterium]|nr:YHS domain-containing protein [Armatimonadota bacterium]
MKNLVAIVAIMAIAGGASFAGPNCGGCAAGSGKEGKTAAKASVVCPVTGQKIASPDKAVAKSTYQGKTYYFCCAGCKTQFDKDPVKFVKKQS